MRGVPLAEVDPPDPALQVVHGLQRLGQGVLVTSLHPTVTLLSDCLLRSSSHAQQCPCGFAWDAVPEHCSRDYCL